MQVGGFNFVAATADDICYRVNILIPERDLSTGALPYLVIDGDIDGSYWDGYLPTHQLPRTRPRSSGSTPSSRSGRATPTSRPSPSTRGYSWADLHGTRFANPFGGELDGGWTPSAGGEDTLNVSSSNFYAGNDGEPAERFDSKSGPIFRIVTTFAEDGTPQATVNFPRGNSGRPESPHFDDTLDDWVEGVYTPLPFRRAEVEAAMESSYVLSP